MDDDDIARFTVTSSSPTTAAGGVRKWGEVSTGPVQGPTLLLSVWVQGLSVLNPNAYSPYFTLLTLLLLALSLSPLYLSLLALLALLTRIAQVQIDAVSLLVKLVLYILLPLLVGKVTQP